MAEVVAFLRVGRLSPGDFKCCPASRTHVL